MQTLHRSVLSVPGHRPSMHAKAAASAADVVMLDLEDSCPAAEKETGRQSVVTSLRELDWGTRTLSLRVNDPASPLCLRDLLEILPAVGDRLHSLVIPKVESAAQIHYLDRLLNALEAESGRAQPLSIEPIIESARALRDATEIATASPRNRFLVFGIADYSASINLPLSSVSGHGEADGDYPGDPLHFVYSRLVLCAKAAGLGVIDAPYGNFRDPAGLERAAHRSRALGFDGKWAIHPDQLDTLNRVFAPGPEEIARARRVLEAHAEAAQAGRGAGSVGGSMVDQASVRLARDVLARAAAAGLS